jgi:hypothetical protein
MLDRRRSENLIRMLNVLKLCVAISGFILQRSVLRGDVMGQAEYRPDCHDLLRRDHFEYGEQRAHPVAKAPIGRVFDGMPVEGSAHFQPCARGRPATRSTQPLRLTVG